MTILMPIAGLAALLFVMMLGKRFIRWLEKKGFRQTVKEEVENRVYSEEDDPTSGSDV